MATREWQRHFWRNTGTNYLRTILRLGSGLILFRLTFQYLSTEAFGFYSLLWSLFGYIILLDFGLGFTAQKAVAEHSAGGETSRLNQLLATIFWSFAGVSLVMLLVFLSGRGLFLQWTHVDVAHYETFGLAYGVFFCAMAVAFPLGIFPEMLRGLQRIDLANWLVIGSTLINLALLAWALLHGWSLPAIVIISVAPSAAAWLMVLPRIKGLSLHPRHYQLRAVRGVLSFSIIAYLITFTNLIMARTDQAVISLSIGIGFIALYQAGYKVSEMFSVQMQDALTPAAAQMNIQNDQAGLRDLLMKSSSLTLLLITPLYALCAAYLAPLVKLLIGLETLETDTYLVGQALLLATYSSLITSSCSKRILMMCGWERRLLRISMVDAIANLALCLFLVHQLGVLGVALGTMIPTVLVGWFWVVPLTAKCAETGTVRLLMDIAVPVMTPIVAGLAVLTTLLWFAPFPSDGGFIDCAWRGLLVLLPVGALGLQQLKALRPSA
ncbi:MAG: oligosaccharide flippase family protein [Candidatus Synoicihabitans palmerolidicus]|nr:oligosaccharide flippase family protein [Candidatus Synoicihabitans palmerolidicus]